MRDVLAPLIASGKPRATEGEGVPAGDDEAGRRCMQVTYNHHLLYTFVKDTKKGQTKAGVTALDGIWYAVSSAGAKVVKQSSGGYGGYGP